MTITGTQLKWDARWLAQTHSISQWSRDPRRKVACLIIDSDNNQLSGGYNGFPRGIVDDDRLNDRATKLKMVVHAEANAVASAARNGHSVKGATAYINHSPCTQCACLLIQAGIKRVVYVTQEGASPEWAEDFEMARGLLEEAGVEVEQVEDKSVERAQQGTLVQRLRAGLAVAAIALINADSYRKGAPLDEAYEIALSLGYEGPLNEADCEKWLREYLKAVPDEGGLK